MDFQIDNIHMEMARLLDAADRLENRAEVENRRSGLHIVRISRFRTYGKYPSLRQSK